MRSKSTQFKAVEVVAAAWLLMFSGCALDPQAPREDGPGAAPNARPAPGRLSFNDDPNYLESRVNRTQRPLPVRAPRSVGRVPSEVSTEAAGKDPVVLATQLELVGEVMAPVVDGHVVQANDIDIDPSSRIAVVGYNLAGEEFAGAMQIVDFRVSDHPVLVAEFLFHDADVNAVLKRGTYVYVGLASNAAGLESPAMMQEFRQFTSGWNTTGQWMSLPSATVTDLAGFGSTTIAVSVGSRNGGVMHVDRTTMHGVAFAAENDTRSLCFDAAGTLWSVSGGAALAHYTLPSLTTLAHNPIDGFGLEGAKGTVESVGSYLYLGAGDGGFQVRDRDGALMETLANSSYGALNPGLAVTNAVSVVGSMAYVAAGALGIQVVDLGRWGGGGTEGLRVLGQLGFEDGFSSNMVKARSNIMVVAAGRGGLELVRLTQTP